MKRDAHTRTITQLETDATTITHGYRHAQHQLATWQTGHPTAVIGASPPTGTNPEPPDNPTTDYATHTLNRLDQLLTQAANQGRQLWADHDGTPIPEPANTEPARLAVIMWTVRRTQKDPHALTLHQLTRYARTLTPLAVLVQTHQPPPPTETTNGCHAHKTANLHAPIDTHYRRWHLCRWCGDFRTLHNTNPPARLIRLHDRGIRTQ